MQDAYRHIPCLPGFLLAGFAALLAARQGTMSVEEAKKVIAQFAGGALVPPPRTFNDITALLDRQALADPGTASRPGLP